MLTKEQKMQMVSDAIDAGFEIEMRHYKASVKQADELLKIFERLPVSNHDLGDGSAVIHINSPIYNDVDDDFEATIFLK